MQRKTLSHISVVALFAVAGITAYEDGVRIQIQAPKSARPDHAIIPPAPVLAVRRPAFIIPVLQEGQMAWPNYAKGSYEVADTYVRPPALARNIAKQGLEVTGEELIDYLYASANANALAQRLLAPSKAKRYFDSNPKEEIRYLQHIIRHHAAQRNLDHYTYTKIIAMQRRLTILQPPSIRTQPVVRTIFRRPARS